MTKSLPWILCALLLAPPAIAQTDQADLVRPLGAADLNSNLARLASNPRDVDALIGAGEAALALDDPHGAAGFFARADAIASGNGRIKAGLARVMLKLQNPAEAVRLFDQAQRLGFPEASILTERGLARDLTGDQAGAQRDYQAALARSPDNAELRRRYAASLGISGQVDAAEKMLEPLLYKSDRAAWRYRAFIYAMNNRQADARKVAEQAMPAQLAAAITPYMQKMPYLTAQQKAAAVHFGQFPSQVGTAVAAVTPTAPPPTMALATPATKPATQVAQASAQTAPTRARPLSRAEQRRQRREAARLARAGAQRTPTPAPTPGFSTAGQPASTAAASATNNAPAPDAPTQVAQAQTVQPLPTRAAQPVVQPLPQAQRSASASASTPPPQLTARVAASAVQGPPAPGFDTIDGRTPAAATPPPATSAQSDSAALAQASPPPAAASTPSAPPAPDPQATRTLADIIRAIDVPDAERQPTVAAVDLNEIAAMQAARRAERQAAAAAAAAKAKKEAAAKAKAEADAKAKKEAEEKKRLAANPSRNWLQVGVGQSKSALAFTMKRLRGKYDSIAPQDAWTAGWGQTNRLLVGPFPSFTRAKELETKLKAAGADVFAWKSDAGEVVEKLAGE
ncbi:SPOR domain-containing protein [Sphingobium lactosutens]|uniref:Sporulation protein n=1 Tax=Sphingobium lactosutens DS20 TaxID=1331060 RepID=T0HJ49_9SPHN|nr:tetratricopeptide repeat protein [Sphingobium lactosutens]EQB13067.1 sporulation protein [Sphingobium lactosutens DS20]